MTSACSTPRVSADSSVPTNTAASKTVALVYPPMKGKLSGSALRVSSPIVSVVDMVLKAASANGMKGIIKDADLPLVMGGNMVKVIC